MDNDSIDLSGLEQLTKLFKKLENIEGRIGILGDKNTRDSDTSTNAGIGKIHEFGDGELPERSFLRMPLNLKYDKVVEEKGAMTEKVMKEIIKKGSALPWFEKMVQVAVEVVLGAFESDGYGKWKKSNMKYKKVHQTLVETQQLRRSITGDAKEKE